MEQSKWIGRSLTIWGAVVTAFSAFAPLLGIDITPEEISSVSDAGADVINALGIAVGTVMTVIGRHRAKSPVTFLPKKG